MNLLLDTQLLLWSAGQSERLPAQARQMIADANNELWFSSASFWEIAIKRGLGRRDFEVEPHLLHRGLLDHGYRELAITSAHTMATEHLPSIHKDPFDRLLIAQAETEGVLLLTCDQPLAQYPGPIRCL
jgi:PIN domain nuclease of toxin-antitoxin system